MLGMGYYWAINRSYDITYRLYDYNSSALAHHVELRGKPTGTSDFDMIVSGVQDLSGDPKSGTPPQKYSGVDIYGAGKADLGKGWTGMGLVNYVTSFRFRQEWTQSYTEGIGSEFHALGFVNRDFGSYTFDAAASRTENFQPEIPVPGANGTTDYLTNAVIIRKLPEASFSGRDQQVKDLPLWFSFDSSAGLMSRSEPDFSGSTLVYDYKTSPFVSRLRFDPRVSSAFHFLGIRFTPSFGLHEAFYGESQTLEGSLYHTNGSDITRSARDFTLDMMLPAFERVFNKKTIFGDKLKHVIEPRATYKYQTGIGTDFDRFVRFDEDDLLVNTNELTLSLTNRIYAKRGETVQEIFTWELSQKRYFDPTFGGALIPGQRNVFDATADITAFAFLTDPRVYSPVASVVRASPITGLGVQWLADYDPHLHRIVDSSFSVDYRWKRYYWFNVGNDTVRSDPVLSGFANQYRFGAGFGDPQHRGINAASNAVYDARNGNLLTWTTQVTYNTNCCGFSAEYRRLNFGIRDESYYAFSFAIANVGTFGTLKKQDRLF
jgi:LPS-assembly protein